MAAVLALSGAALWGVGDFLGGLAARRLAVLVVLAISQAIGLAGVLVWVLVARDPFPGLGELLPAAAAGVAGLVGLGALYRGLAIGAMGIVAPISAASPVVPLAVDAARGITPDLLQWLGVALVLVGIVTLSREPSGAGPRIAAGAGLALVAALGFGSFVVGLDAGSDESAPWAVVAARSASVAIALLAILFTSTSLRAPRSLLPAARRDRRLRHGRERVRRLRDDEGRGRDRRGAERALPGRHDRARPRRARGATEPSEARIGGVVALGGAALVAAG